MTSCLASDQLQNLIAPMANGRSVDETEPAIREVVQDILSCAQSFVPCEAGSLMLSHPEQQRRRACRVGLLRRSQRRLRLMRR